MSLRPRSCGGRVRSARVFFPGLLNRYPSSGLFRPAAGVESFLSDRVGSLSRSIVLCLCHCVSVYQIGYSTGQSWVRENQVRDLAELSAFPGYADTVSVDPNLHVVAHPKVGEK